MLNIKSDDSKPYVVRVNGKTYAQSSASSYGSGTPMLSTRNAKLRRVLLRTPIGEIQKKTFMLSFDLEGLDFSPFTECDVHSADRFDDAKIELRVTWATIEWQKPYTIIELSRAVTRTAEALPDYAAKSISEGEEGVFTIGIRFSLRDRNESLGHVLNRVGPRAQEIFSKAEQELNTSIPADALVTYFDFPAPIRTACSQYLLYFTEFLDDLGVEANAQIGQKARQVLFTVTPTSGAEALQLVREALEIYLRLPSMATALREQVARDRTNIALAQLQLNVEALRVQNELQRSMLELKDATIEHLQITRHQYHQTVTSAGSIAEAGPLREAKELAETEPLIGKVVSVTKFSFKGLQIDLPALLRMLKRRFKR